MTQIDTSAEAVEAMAECVLRIYGPLLKCLTSDDHILVKNKALLRALLARAEAAERERDMWRHENLKKQTAVEQMAARIVALEARA